MADTEPGSGRDEAGVTMAGSEAASPPTNSVISMGAVSTIMSKGIHAQKSERKRRFSLIGGLHKKINPTDGTSSKGRAPVRRQSSLFIGGWQSASRKVAQKERRASEFVTKEVEELTNFVTQACDGIEFGTFSLIDNYVPMPMNFDELSIPSELDALIDLLCVEAHDVMRQRKLKVRKAGNHVHTISSRINFRKSSTTHDRKTSVVRLRSHTSRARSQRSASTMEWDALSAQSRLAIRVTCADVLKFFLGAGFCVKKCEELKRPEERGKWEVCDLESDSVADDFVELAALQTHERWAKKMKSDGYVYGSSATEGKKVHSTHTLSNTLSHTLL
jgi:hypothetical protein